MDYIKFIHSPKPHIRNAEHANAFHVLLRRYYKVGIFDTVNFATQACILQNVLNGVPFKITFEN